MIIIGLNYDRLMMGPQLNQSNLLIIVVKVKQPLLYKNVRLY